MKTKNIFRMLLVAAALLMGANNVKAETRTTIFEDSNAQSYNYIQFAYGAFDNANVNDKLIVSYWTATGDWAIAFNNVLTQKVDNSGTAEIILTTDILNSINKSNSDNASAWMQGQFIAITKVELVTYGSTPATTYSITIDNNIQNGSVTASKTSGINAGETITLTATPATGYELDEWNVTYGNNSVTVLNNQFSMPSSNVTVSATFTKTSSTSDTPAWTGNHYLGNWGGDGGSALYLPAGTFSTLKCDGNDIIRVYGRLGNLAPTGNTTYGIEFVTLDWHNYLKLHGTDNFSNGYVDIPINAAGISCTEGTLLSPIEFASYLKNTNNNNNCAVVNGYNFYVTSIVVNPSNTSTNSYSVTVNASNNGSASVNKSSAAAGETVTVTISPNSGYALESISVKDASNNPVTLTGSGNTRTFTMPASNVTISTTFAEAHYLTFKTSEYCAADWNEQTSTFSWGPSYPGWGNSEWNFMEAVNISGDLSGWKRLHLHVSNWNNASAQQLTVVFKKNDGSNPPSGPTKEFVVSPDGSGNIDINLEGIDWGDCDIYNIHDLTIYGCTRDNTSNDASVVVTDVYYISSTSAKQNVTLSFTSATATATMGETDFLIPTLVATVNNQTVTNLNISYESSDTDVATVDSSTGDITLVGPGITTITASFSGDDDYNAAQSVSYRLTVLEAAPTEDDYIDVDEGNHAISLFGYRTYVTEEAVDFSRSIGVEGYYATRLNEDGTEVVFTQVTGVCPEEVPLLLKAKSGATEYKLLKSSVAAPAATVEALNENKLQAGNGETVYGANKYVLTIHSNEVVFAEVNIEGAVVDSEHAYLDLNNTNAARGRLAVRFVNESTGISNIETETIGDDVIYNLRGQRVENPTKGLYIINGKKVVIK